MDGNTLLVADELYDTWHVDAAETCTTVCAAVNVAAPGAAAACAALNYTVGGSTACLAPIRCVWN